MPAGYGWSFPADGELRIGVGSFDPRFHVREPTVRLAEDLGAEPVRYQGNWIPHALRDATEDGVFFVGDSAGHCLPLTAEGIRTALYFGIACGRELRAVLAGDQTREQALRALPRVLRRPRDASSAGCCGCSGWFPRVAPRAARPAAAAIEQQALHRLVLRPLPEHRPPGLRGRRRRRRAPRRVPLPAGACGPAPYTEPEARALTDPRPAP